MTIKPFPAWLLLMPVLCVLAACGGGANIHGNSAVQVAVGAASSEVAPVVPVVSNDVEQSSDEIAVVTEATQSSNTSTNVPEPVPPAEPVIQSPEALQLPIDTGADSTRVDPPPNPVVQPVVIEVPKEYSSADITDLILITGQSNALGADTTYDSSKDSPHERIFAFTEDGWLPADLHQVWDLDWFPRGNPGGDPSNNLSLHAAKEIVRMRSDRVVGFVLASAPGEGIEHWDENGDFFAEINRKVLAAINELPHKSGIDAVLWHQGETDAGDSTYGQKLDRVVASFRHQSWFASDLPFICGETAAFDVVNQQLMALNSNGDYWTSCVDSAGLETREDGFHFNAEGLRELGRRYGAQYLNMD